MKIVSPALLGTGQETWVAENLTSGQLPAPLPDKEAKSFAPHASKLMADARHPSCALKALRKADLRQMDALGHDQRGAKDLASLSESAAGS